RIRTLYAQREPIYRRAGTMILTEGRLIPEIVSHVLRVCQRGYGTAHGGPVSVSPAETERREQLRARLNGLGFDAVRFAALVPFPDPGLRAWLAAGHHADMDWLARSADKRLDPHLVLAGAQAAICWA
ncbi:MAG: hypothetical protein IPL39_06770, partial [Opitutaceae bacterium]|nr:hypothetical protein [Opitutaceae bacterium]